MINKPFKFTIGILFLIFGALILLINFDIIPNLDFIQYFKGFWAIGLILSGILIILKKKLIAIIILSLSLVLGILVFVTPISDASFEVFHFEENLLIKNNNKDIIYDIEFGAGELFIQSIKNNETLTKVKSSSSINSKLIANEEVEENEKTIEIYQRNEKNIINNLFNENTINKLNISVNENKEIKKIDLDFGAAEAIIDLRNLNIQKADLSFGAASAKIYLDNNIDLKINSGASDIQIKYPKNKNIRIETNGGLIGAEFEGFKKINNKYYNNYENKSIDIFIDIKAGASSISGGYYDEIKN